MTRAAFENELARCSARQREAAEHLLNGGPEKRGAALGLADWVGEEVRLRKEYGQ